MSRTMQALFGLAQAVASDAAEIAGRKLYEAAMQRRAQRDPGFAWPSWSDIGEDERGRWVGGAGALPGWRARWQMP